jgi:serine/threonine protein kinase
MIAKTLDNKYRIISELGEGMGGTVYLAEHTRGIGKKFAIESLSFTLGLDSHFRERFCREATNQALLDHSNIVQTTDYFEEDGQLFLVMEYVDCQDLRKLIKARVKLKEKDALSILGDALRGLEYAHTKGVIHGCIQPSNIIIDKSGLARIKNFGIVSLVVEGLTEGSAFGSPRYMSPEQIQHPGQLDLRTDIYSSGIVLYEMLTGEVPFDGETDFSIQMQQIQSPPPNLHLKNPEISEKVAKIVLKAMAKNRAERFQNCSEFLQCLPEQERQRSEADSRRKTEEQNRQLTTSGHVFICYAREDEAFVLQLAGNLKGRDVPVWLDQWDIPAGADWDRSIDDAIYDCAKFIIVLSSQSVESSEVRGELRTALDERKPIVPVIHSRCRVPRQLRTIQHVDFTSRGPDDETALRQLLLTLATSTAAGVAQQIEPIDRKRSTSERALERRETKLKDRSQGEQEAEQRRLETEAQRKLEERLREEERQQAQEEAQRKAEKENRARQETERRLRGAPNRPPATPDSNAVASGIAQERSPLAISKRSPDNRILERPVNLGFDGPTAANEMPNGWFNSEGHVSNVSTRYSVRVVRRDDGVPGSCVVMSRNNADIGEFGSLMQRVQARYLAGKTIKYEGELRAEGIDGWAGLWLRVDGAEIPDLIFDNMHNRAIRGTTPWTRFELSVKLPEETVWLNYGIVISGSGRLWADNCRILVWSEAGQWSDL